VAGESILIVDDNMVNLELAEYTLERAGYTVRMARDAAEAQKIIESFRPALILMDVQLPGMSGLELTRLIKADSQLHDIIVVALTSYAMRGDEQKALDSGCDGYITKPIETRSFADDIAGYLRD
jgi:CheY-like chemotaxis protein